MSLRSIPARRRLIRVVGPRSMKCALFTLFLFSALLTSCNEWWIDTCWESDGYRLIAIDARSQMSLISEEDKGLILIGATIFAVGADAKHIVLKQHPASDLGATSFDRSITNYFIVEKRSGSFKDREAGVRGPLTKEEFERLASTLSLPKFSKTFDDLK
jgi:hypothetical protein